MGAMDLERQQYQVWQARKQQEAMEKARTEHQALIARVKAQKQTVFEQAILDQLMSDAGYKGYRIQLDTLEGGAEWEVYLYTEGWGWNLIDSLGFKQGHVTVYKTLAGACRRIKKELGAKHEGE